MGAVLISLSCLNGVCGVMNKAGGDIGHGADFGSGVALDGDSVESFEDGFNRCGGLQDVAGDEDVPSA